MTARLQASLKITNGGERELSAFLKLEAEVERLKADNERTHALVRDVSATRDTAVNMHLKDIAEVARLTSAIRRIDGINDNPADYNPAINAVCDAILCPHLEPKL